MSQGQGWRLGLRKKVPEASRDHDWDESATSTKAALNLNAYLDFVGSRKAQFGMGHEEHKKA